MIYILTTGLVYSQNYYGNKGSTAILKSDLRDPTETGSPFIAWSNVDNGRVYSDGTNVASYPETQGRLSVVGNHSAGEFFLQISNITEYDEGKYSCSISIGGVLNRTFVNAYLRVSPFNVSIQNVISVRKLLGTEGQDLMVSCVAIGGKPPPSVTVMIDGATLVGGVQSVTASLNAIARLFDRKMVTCESSNEYNSQQPVKDTAQIYLDLKPLQPIFNPDPVSTEETIPLVVSCTSTGSRPAATFHWTIGLANVTFNSTTRFTYEVDDTYTVISTLTCHVDRTYNRLNITCKAVNIAALNGVQVSKILDIKFAPNITVTNLTNRTMTCIPVGNPASYTYYKWQHRTTYGELIRELDGGQNGVLTLPSVSVEARYQDSGEYVCTAGNGITDRDGRINQTGSGYVTFNAQPAFTNGNKDTEYGEFGSDVTVHVYVYSFPKFTSVVWYKSNMQILPNDKYTFSESRATVNDIFHGTLVQLDGYRVKLIINNLVESDFNVSYRVELSNGIGQPVVYNTVLLSVGAPQTPINFTVLRSTESSIIVQWEAGYNGGHEQTFYLQFRRFGSSAWVTMKIPDTKQSGMQTYTLSELQDGILFESKMYAENMVKKSLPTEAKTIATIKDSRLSSSEAIIKGVAGSMSAVIFIMCIIIALVILWKKGNNRPKSKAQYSRWKEETAYSIPMDVKETDENNDTVNKRGKHIKTITGSAKEYETLGMKDNSNTYSDILSKKGQQQSEKSAQEYETLGTVDNPNIYSALNSQSAQPSSEYTNIEI